MGLGSLASELWFGSLTVSIETDCPGNQREEVKWCKKAQIQISRLAKVKKKRMTCADVEC